MTSYKFYQDMDFDVADSPRIIDIFDDLGGTFPVTLVVDKKELLIELEFNTIDGFEDQFPLHGGEQFSTLKVRRVRLSTVKDNTSYRIWSGT